MAPAQAFRCQHLGAAMLLLFAAARGSTRRAVQLCACDPEFAASQTWVWGKRVASSSGPGSTTQAARLTLASDTTQCLYKGLGPRTPSYLYVDTCSTGAPLFVFNSSMKPLMERDLQTLASSSGEDCMDADGMSRNLQMYRCIPGDNDQQYAGVEGTGLVVDLWTGFSNCVGVAGPQCPPPRGIPFPSPSPSPAPGPSGAPSTWLSPQYHLNDGGQLISDPSGPIQVNGTWIVFPDQSKSSKGTAGGSYKSTDLVHWTRLATNMVFYETGGVAITDQGKAVTFGGGYRYIKDVSADPLLTTWASDVRLGDKDPHVAGRGGELPATLGESPHSGLFRVGDPSRPFKYKGRWYLVLGGGRNASARLNVTQGEARLVRAVNDTLEAWEFVSVMFASNKTIGRWREQLSNMFECPDFFPIGPNGKWMFVTSQIFQGHRWVTGGQHHWDQYRIGTFDGTTFTPEVEGVLDYGYVAAGKTGAPVANDPMGRRVFFGWNMPWSRQGPGTDESPELGPTAAAREPTKGTPGATRADGSRGAGGADTGARAGGGARGRARRRWHGRHSAGAATPGVVWPYTAPFGSQILPRDLSLFDDGTLRMRPVPELASLRKAGSRFTQAHVAESVTCFPLNGTQLEVLFTVQVGASEGGAHGAGRFPSVAVLASPDRRERTLVGANSTHLIVNQHNSTLKPDLTPDELAKVKFFWDNAAANNHTTLYAPLPANSSHTIHIFLDGMNLEVFADERVAITTNLFPTLRSSTCLGADVPSSSGAIVQLEAYALTPAPVAGVGP